MWSEIRDPLDQYGTRAVKADTFPRYTGIQRPPMRRSLCFWGRNEVARRRGAQLLRGYLQHFAQERLSEHEAERLVVLGVEATSPRPFDALVVVEPKIWQLPAQE